MVRERFVKKRNFRIEKLRGQRNVHTTAQKYVHLPLGRFIGHPQFLD